MDYPFLHTNLQVLAGQGAAIYPWLKPQKSEYALPGKIITNRWGVLDWEFRPGQGLFQNVQPQQIYRAWQAVSSQPGGGSLVVGSNLGYGLHYLLQQGACGHAVMVLEPRKEMLLATLGLSDYSSFLKQKRLVFIPACEEMLRKMVYQLTPACLFGKVTLRPDLISRQLGPEYALWHDRCRATLEDMRVELYTLRHRQDTMMRNELENLARARQESSLRALKGRAQGLKAVALGAGPSLEQFAPRLVENPGRALYVTSLQTLPVLQSYGLKPHLCLALECAPVLERVYEALDRNWARDIPLVYSVHTWPGAIKAYPGPTIPLWTQGGLTAPFLSDQEPVMEPGSNVALTILRFLKWCGVGQVLLAGHDFAWAGAKTHARQHLAAQHDFPFDAKLHVLLKNKEGETIYSAPSYLTALRSLETDIRSLGIPVYLLYGGGAVIQNCALLDWEEVQAQGHLEGCPESLRIFLDQLGMHIPLEVGKTVDQAKAIPIALLKNYRGRLKKMFQSGRTDPKMIRNFLQKILCFLDHNPFVKPLLVNEMLNLAGYIQGEHGHGREEWICCKRTINNMIEKLDDMDKRLSPFFRLHPVKMC